MTDARSYREKVHKVLDGSDVDHPLAPSQQVFTIRKLRQRDFFPAGLIGVALSMNTDEIGPETVLKYLEEHPVEFDAQEISILIKGVVSPRITYDPKDETAVCIEDLGLDREFLVEQIANWAGFKISRDKKTESEVEKFREGELGPGADGQLLPHAAEPAP